jgi:thiol-disulfide isomerase/thioredoxin
VNPSGEPTAKATAAEKNAPQQKPNKPAPQQGALGPRAVLEKMVAAYHKASTYQDLGRVQMSAQYAAEQADERQRPFSVVLVRPNKLQVKAYDALVVADGKQFRATIDDLPGQVLTKDDPAALTLPLLDSDPVLSQSLRAGPTGLPIQLALLLDKDPLKWLCKGDEAIEMGEPGEIGGRDCYRVKIARADGTMVLWIDQETFALLRMLPPLDFVREELEKQGQLQSLSLVVEFTGAKLDAPVDPGLFAFDLPKDAEAVKYFLPSPARLLGKKSPPLKFLDLSGKPVTSQSLAGKIVVLCFWHSSYPPSQKTLPLLEQIYQKYKGNDRVAFLAVSFDDPKTDNKSLQEVLDQWKVHMPVVREPAGSKSGPPSDPLRYKNCRLVPAPPIFVLGADGVVQYFTIQYADDRGQPSFVKELPERLDQLLAGKDVYPLELQRFDEEQNRYQEALAAAMQGKPPAGGRVKEIAIPQAKIAPRSDPKHLKLTPLWKCVELKKPGNILVVPHFGGAPRLEIIDSWDSIAEVGLNGKLLAAHKLDIQKGELICSLRTAVGGNGKRLFAGSAIGQQRLHLFDENWNLLASYPADALENPHSGIMDVQLADLEGDGKLQLYVSYLGVVGLQKASLDGKRLSSNRLLNNVHMAIGPAKKGRRNLVCSNIHGSLVTVDSNLNVLDEVFLSGRNLQWIAATEASGDEQVRFCGLSVTPRAFGQTVAVSFTLRGEELWSYALPQGFLSQPIEPILAGKVTAAAAGQWLLPGADGSIHILDADGKLVDQFNYGAVLCGLATVEIDGKPALIVATPGGVEALRVE